MQPQKPASKWKELFSSKRISLALLSINLNSVVTAPVYATFIAVEAIFPIYALAVIMQSQIYDKRIQDIWTVESYLNSDPILDFLIMEIVMLVLFVILLLTIGLICYRVDSFAKVKGSSTLQSIASILTYSLGTFLTGLYLHIQIRVFFIGVPSSNVGGYVALEILNAINFSLLVWLQLFLKRVITLKLPYERQPSAQIDYKNSYLVFLLEIGIIGIEVLLASFPAMEDSLKIISIVVLLFTIIVCLSKQFVVPIYNRTINVTLNFMLWTILSCSFIVVINSFDDDPDSINVYYIILLLPFMLAMSFLVQYHWEYRVMDKIRVGQSKMEMQHQYILYLLTEHVNNLKGDKEHQIQSLKYLFGILDDHNGECLKNSCLCHQAESIVWILNQRNDENQQVIELNSQDIEFLNNIQNDTLYAKEHFSYAPFTFNDYQDKKYIMIRKKSNKTSTKILDDDQFQIEFVFEDERTGEQLVEDNFLLKIDPQKLKQAFFANFVRQYYEQAVQKFPESYTIKIMYAHFALYNMKNLFLCINILKTVDESKLSFIERCNYNLCENLLIQDIYFSAMSQENYQQGFQHDLLGVTNFQKVNHKSTQDLRKLDPESFLQYSRLQESFHSTTIELSKQILQFWQTISEPALQVDKVIKESFRTALLISETHETFKQMDEANKNKNEKIYYNFAIIHQQLLNDNQNYNLYIQKMKNIISMKKFIKSNFQITESFSDQSILLVSGKMENYGKIIECNKQFQRLTGYRWADLRYSSYELIMNDLIKSKHNSFVNEFNKTGEKVILDKRVNQFLKRKNGYVIPVSLVIRNHFSDTYGFTFIGFFSEIQDIQLDGTSSLGIPTKDLMFILCDNHEGRVYNVCKNTAKYLGIKKHYLIENSSYLDFEIRANHISSYFDINLLKEAVRLNDTNRDNLFYGMFKIDLNCISQRVQSVFLSTNYVNARFKIFCEQFQNRSFEYYTIVIQLLDKDVTTQPKFFMTQEVDRTPSAVLGELEQADQILAIENDAVSSHTSSDSSKQADQIKSQNISMERTTPRSLKIVIQLLLLMFVTMITVSTVNLYLSQSRQDQIVKMISVANLSSSRLGEIARTRLVVRQMLNIANGYENIVTTYSANKTQNVYDNLLKALESLKTTEDRLQSENNIFDSSFTNYVSNNLVPLLYLDQNGVIYSEQHTMSYLVNIYIQKLLEIYNIKLNSLKTKMNIQSLKTVQTGFKPSQVEQSLFFVIKNGNDILNYYSWLVDDMYNQQIENFSKSTIDQTQLTVLISVFTILAVFLIVTPIISMIQDRQFIAIGFFVQIPKLKVQDLIIQTEQCLDLLMKEDDAELAQDNGINNQQSMRKSRKSKGLKNHERENESENSSKIHEDYSLNNDQSLNGVNLVNNSMMNYTKQENTISEMDILVTLQNDKALFNPESAMRDSSFDFSANFEEHKHSGVHHQRKASSSMNVNHQKNMAAQRAMLGDQAEKYYRYSDNQLDSSIPQSSYVSGPYGNPQENEDFERQRGLAHNSGILRKQISDEEQMSEQDERKEKLSILNIAKKRRRINGVLIALVFVTCFCLYFMGSFFLTQNLYNRILELYQDLNTIYNKDVCMENVMSYLRETYAQNISYPLFELGSTSSPQVATTFYLKQCLELENEYTKIRKKQDEALDDARQYMQDVESSQLCEVTLKGSSDYQYVPLCKSSYNGILTKGMSNAISIFLSNLNQYDLQFKSTRNRTQTDLINLMKNPDQISMIDMKIYFMDRTFSKLKDICFQSSQNYFDKQLRGYIVFFCAFIIITVILLIATLILGLTRMRNYLWKINLSMKILPLDCLQNSTISALKKFFKS